MPVEPAAAPGLVDSGASARCWEAYLLTSTWSDALLDGGLLDGYLSTVDNLDQLSAELVGNLAAHLARVALGSKIRPLPWVRKYVAKASLENRCAWIERVAWYLDSLEPAAVEQQWQRWMKQHWNERLNDIPRPLTQAEASAMAAWVVYLTKSVDEGIALVRSRPAGLTEHDLILDRLEGEGVRRAPRSFGKLIAHLLKSTELPCWGLHELPSIVADLKASAESDDLHTIIQEAVRLGNLSAPTWIR